MKLRKRNLFVLLISVSVICLLLYIVFAPTTRVYGLTYPQTERILLDALHLDANLLFNNPKAMQAKVGPELNRYMKMKLYRVSIARYIPGEYLSMTVSHQYNIGATGQERVTFIISRKSKVKTSVTVDYCNRWVGIFPPFVYYSSSSINESRIQDLIWGSFKLRITNDQRLEYRLLFSLKLRCDKYR